MSEFKIGDKVECIALTMPSTRSTQEKANDFFLLGTDLILPNKVYIIQDIVRTTGGVRLEGHQFYHNPWWFQLASGDLLHRADMLNELK